MKARSPYWPLGLVLLGAGLISGCLAGTSGPFGPQDPAGFFAGLWHGFIAWISFILSLFTEVRMYAVDNTGAGYNLGFLIGMACWLGGGGGGSLHYQKKSRRQKEWDEVARKVEAKVKRDLGEWAQAGDADDWPEVERKVEEKLKAKIREWADS
ncbi:MAG: hypothetical protein K9K66_16480 [Desulfarculaceae bacterium]|nr:hypothetical protein [Desulfarculaceae bacterium]MCF8074154.1 hypothetical protein [Desulfarculaceae bacterium]MCF8103254.1 hypothetical protein [Desulfarculaceae bacterium]MCF8116888.1 hypothetical protein [Desulfarculaceae bacterium]